MPIRRQRKYPKNYEETELSCQNLNLLLHLEHKISFQNLKKKHLTITCLFELDTEDTEHIVLIITSTDHKIKLKQNATHIKSRAILELKIGRRLRKIRIYF